MKSEEIMPDGVTVPPRLRAVDTAKVKQLAQSMEAIGLQQPITCWQEADDKINLVTGAHRLAAAKSLGWEWIDAVFTTADEIDRQLWEIDENLMRSELTPAQSAQHLAKRKELWAQRKSGAGCTTLQTGRGNKQFASDTAEATGVSKSTVTRAIARAEAIPEDVLDQLRGTRLDTGVYMDHLKNLPHDTQREKVVQDLRRVADNKPTKPSEPPREDPDAEQFEALKRAWNRASSEARRRFEIWQADA